MNAANVKTSFHLSCDRRQAEAILTFPFQFFCWKTACVHQASASKHPDHSQMCANTAWAMDSFNSGISLFFPVTSAGSQHIRCRSLPSLFPWGNTLTINWWNDMPFSFDASAVCTLLLPSIHPQTIHSIQSCIGSEWGAARFDGSVGRSIFSVCASRFRNRYTRKQHGVKYHLPKWNTSTKGLRRIMWLAESGRKDRRIERNAEIKSSKVIRCASKPQIPVQSKQREPQWRTKMPKGNDKENIYRDNSYFSLCCCDDAATVVVVVVSDAAATVSTSIFGDVVAVCVRAEDQLFFASIASNADELTIHEFREHLELWQCIHA